MIALQPKRAHAYNAFWQYSFADRNINLDEARTLIEKAHELAPDDAATRQHGLDCVPAGRLEDAAAYLKRAFDKFQDEKLPPTRRSAVGAGPRDEASGRHN